MNCSFRLGAKPVIVSVADVPSDRLERTDQRRRAHARVGWTWTLTDMDTDMGVDMNVNVSITSPVWTRECTLPEASKGAVKKPPRISVQIEISNHRPMERRQIEISIHRPMERRHQR